MAEIMIHYVDLERCINNSIEEIKDEEKKTKTTIFKKEILAALTVSANEYGQERSAQNESLLLWNNKESLPNEKAEILLGPYYVQIEKIFWEETLNIISKGILAAILSRTFPTDLDYINLIEAKDIVRFLTGFFKSITKLNEFERCIFYHVAEHFGEKDIFSVEALSRLIPANEMGICDMHPLNKGCGCCEKETDMCTCKCMGALDCGIKSLVEKEIIKPVCTGLGKCYKFL